jgi:hypothetical protein
MNPPVELELLLSFGIHYLSEHWLLCHFISKGISLALAFYKTTKINNRSNKGGKFNRSWCHLLVIKGINMLGPAWKCNWSRGFALKPCCDGNKDDSTVRNDRAVGIPLLYQTLQAELRGLLPEFETSKFALTQLHQRQGKTCQWILLRTITLSLCDVIHMPGSVSLPTGQTEIERM